MLLILLQFMGILLLIILFEIKRGRISEIYLSKENESDMPRKKLWLFVENSGFACLTLTIKRSKWLLDVNKTIVFLEVCCSTEDLLYWVEAGNHPVYFDISIDTFHKFIVTKTMDLIFKTINLLSGIKCLRMMPIILHDNCYSCNCLYKDFIFLPHWM